MTNFKFLSSLKTSRNTILLHETVSNNSASGIRERKKKKKNSKQ